MNGTEMDPGLIPAKSGMAKAAMPTGAKEHVAMQYRSSAGACLHLRVGGAHHTVQHTKPTHVIAKLTMHTP